MHDDAFCDASTQQVEQEDHTFKVIFSYVVRPKPTWATREPVLKEKKKKKSKPLALSPPFSTANSQLLFLNIGTFDLAVMDKFMSPQNRQEQRGTHVSPLRSGSLFHIKTQSLGTRGSMLPR